MYCDECVCLSAGISHNGNHTAELTVMMLSVTMVLLWQHCVIRYVLPRDELYGTSCVFISVERIA